MYFLGGKNIDSLPLVQVFCIEHNGKYFIYCLKTALKLWEIIVLDGFTWKKPHSRLQHSECPSFVLYGPHGQ